MALPSVVVKPFVAYLLNIPRKGRMKFNYYPAQFPHTGSLLFLKAWLFGVLLLYEGAVRRSLVASHSISFMALWSIILPFPASNSIIPSRTISDIARESDGRSTPKYSASDTILHPNSNSLSLACCNI